MYQKEMTISMQKKNFRIQNCFEVPYTARPIKLFDPEFFNKKNIYISYRKTQAWSNFSPLDLQFLEHK